MTQPDPWTSPATATDAEALRKILNTRTSEAGALVAGVKLAGKTALVGLPVAVAYGLVSGLVGTTILSYAMTIKDNPTPGVDVAFQVTAFLAFGTLLYALIQFTKRDTVSRASWWPALFAMPLALTAGALGMITTGTARDMGPLALEFFVVAWGLVWMSFGGAAAAIVYVRTGWAALADTPVGAAELVDEVRTRTIEIAAPHGAKVHAVTFGAQLILPGIFYALSYAFVDMIAVVNPERPSLRRSSQLTFGMKGRLFRMFLIVFLITNLVSYPIALVVQGTPFADMPTKFGEMLIDPTATSAPALVVQEVLGSISMWISTLAVLVLYVEREGQVLAKSALKKLQTPA